MPTAVADKIADKFVGHDVNLMRLQASHRQTMLRALTKLEAELEAKLMKHTAGEETFTMQRNRALLKETRRVIETAYNGITTTHRGLLRELGAYELAASARIVNRQLGVNLLSVGVPETVIKAMLDNNTLFGAPLESYWAQQSVALQNRFALTMRAGMFAGEPTAKLIQRVRGTKANNFKDGIMKTARHGAELVVRTAAQSILNDARMAMYQDNEDVIEGVQALVTLDERTSEICMARSGMAWTLDGDPFPDTDTEEDFPGPPPWHPNCRSTLIPIVKSADELLGKKGLDKTMDAVPQGTQASMNGQVAGDLTYGQWLEGQPRATQLDVLGEGRLGLWEKGKISLRDLIDQRGNPLTLKQLRQREA